MLYTYTFYLSLFNYFINDDLIILHIVLYRF